MPPVPIGARSEAWILATDFPARAGTDASQECLFHLQSDTPRVNVAFFGAFRGDQHIRHSANVHFQIVPSSIAPRFVIEHTPFYRRAADGGMTAAQLEDYQNKRLTVEFEAYHGGSVPEGRGNITTYTTRQNNQPPPGPCTFSDQ